MLHCNKIDTTALDDHINKGYCLLSVLQYYTYKVQYHNVQKCTNFLTVIHFDT